MTDTSACLPLAPGTMKLPLRMVVGGISFQPAGVVQWIGAELTGMAEASAPIMDMPEAGWFRDGGGWFSLGAV